ncbi:3D domain-containing protein [Solibacillus sp. CAU 1738]|uniref:3D domain-containing protein n=1 Tax=Solibacillus sp. CAU 1738 TaxID=3140363 RepID=UPI00326173EE
MLKIRAFFVIAFIVFSTNSVSYATTIFPVSINDVYSTVNDMDGKMDIHAWDALDSTVVLNEQIEEKFYTVSEGDNLFRIALEHNVSLESLMSMNNLTSHLIYPGDELKVDGEESIGTTIQEIESDKQQKIVASTIYSPPAIVESTEEIEPAPSDEESIEMVVTATAYTAYCTGCSGTTAYGIDLRANPNQKVIAVDPRVIPLGTRVWVEGYGEAIAGDTGGAIKGNKIDVFIPSHDNAMAWGVKTVKIKVLN